MQNPNKDRASQIQSLLNAHHRLDHMCRQRGEKPFISDWYCEHPFAEVFVKDLQNHMALDSKGVLPYYFQNDHSELPGLIRSFHADRNENIDELFISAGLSSLITAQMAMLARRGLEKIHYVRPLYYTYYFLAELFGIDLIPVNRNPLFSVDETLELPAKGGYLLMADPIWYAGAYVRAEHIKLISDWQEATDSWVLVDGAFQYFDWRSLGSAVEQTSNFHEARTIRNICPTRALLSMGRGSRIPYCPRWSRRNSGIVTRIQRDQGRYSTSTRRP